MRIARPWQMDAQSSLTPPPASWWVSCGSKTWGDGCFPGSSEKLRKAENKHFNKAEKKLQHDFEIGKKVDMEMHRLKKVNDFRPET